MPKTFSSEIGDVHDQRDGRPSFTNEFRGASDSLIERERPPRLMDIGRRGRRVALLLLLLTATLGGGGWALWFWSEPIGAWILSWGSDPEQPAGEGAEQPAEQPAEAPAEQPERVFGVKGAPGDGPAAPAVEPAVEPAPEPAPAPAPKPARVETSNTSVRGALTSASVGARLRSVDAALATCWERAAALPGTKRPGDLRLRFSIKWNGRAFGVAVTGEAPAQVRSCVRDALPSGGWPHPRDGGDAQVTRTWALE